jgi:hypothetical protein
MHSTLPFTLRRCPVCGCGSSPGAPIEGWGTWRRCDSCQMDFADPLQLLEKPEEMFSAAYAGGRTASGMAEFGERMDERAALMGDSSLWFWTPAFGIVLDWVETMVPKGGTVLELGCGLGYVLSALKQRGFDPVGLDVAELVVELNRRDGMKVWHGTVDTVPEGWVQPEVIVAFFMMHHLPDPMAFLSTIRAKWPNAPIAVAQYGPSNQWGATALPPRTLIHWSGAGLKAALERSGYEATTISVPSTGADRRPPALIERLLKPTVRVPALRRLERRIQRRVMPLLPGKLADEEYVVVAMGRPQPISNS